MHNATTWRGAAEDVGNAAEAVDEPLVLAAKRDPAAFLLLYERHRMAVYRYLRARAASDDDAADLTATTFERAFAAVAAYRDGDGARFRGWLFRIARNAAIDAARRRRPATPLDAAIHIAGSAGDEPELRAIGAESAMEVRALVATLPEPQREAIVLRFAAGLTAREIGDVLGKSEAATQKILTRALLRLKESYGARD